ncbi:uncharacterized protein LOC132549664 [Ylistrum balloti]|uniref:uncharacterized protein LOC132549664 n=1 Tax=Ylistrum balloti TaxID=509963 RepID=UPI002905E5F2|nr:uncharacterized protein LOC132549664 [Ylistrum balloti]
MSSVVVLGHSFIRRLDLSLTGLWTNLGFDPQQLHVLCLSKSGGKIPNIYARGFTDAIQQAKPSVVLLQIGGNDLDCADIERVKDTIVTDLFSIAGWLVHGFDIQRVGFLQLFYRQKTRVTPVSVYNASVDWVNSTLKQRCAVSNVCIYWRHKGLKHGVSENLCRDGVHLSDKGMRKYIYSVRGAALPGVRLAGTGT